MEPLANISFFRQTIIIGRDGREGTNDYSARAMHAPGQKRKAPQCVGTWGVRREPWGAPAYPRPEERVSIRRHIGLLCENDCTGRTAAAPGAIGVISKLPTLPHADAFLGLVHVDLQLSSGPAR